MAEASKVVLGHFIPVGRNQSMSNGEQTQTDGQKNFLSAVRFRKRHARLATSPANSVVA